MEQDRGRRNLLNETLIALYEHDYTKFDIDYVQGKEYGISVDRFITLAKHTEYVAGYGLPKVATDLVIAMRDGSWFSRKIADGNEYWQHRSRPVKLPVIDARTEKLVSTDTVINILSTINDRDL